MEFSSNFEAWFLHLLGKKLKKNFNLFSLIKSNTIDKKEREKKLMITKKTNKKI